MPIQKMEDIIREVLTGDAQKNALEFAMHLRKNGMTFEKAQNGYWKDKPYWHIKYRDQYVCFVFVHGSPAKYVDEPEGWTIWTDDSESNWFSDYPLDEPMKQVAWNHVDVCGNCTPGGPCAGGTRKTIFGKDFDHVCRTTMVFINPDLKALACLKKLVEIRKEDILSKSECFRQDTLL